MVKILQTGGTKVYKFDAQDKREIGMKKNSSNYAIEQGKKVRGFKTLAEVNRALGTRYTTKTFDFKDPSRKPSKKRGRK